MQPTKKRVRTSLKASFLDLLPLATYTAVVLHLDAKSLNALAQCSKLCASIFNAVHIAASMETKAIAYDPAAGVPKKGDRVGACMREYPSVRERVAEVCSLKDYLSLLQLAVLCGKLQHYYRRQTVEGLGGLAVTMDVYALLPPGFVSSIFQLSQQCREENEEVMSEAAQLMATAIERGALIEYLRIQAEKQGELEDDDIHGSESTQENKHELFYNAKQDLLNRIVDVLEDQFNFCAKLFRFQSAKVDEAVAVAKSHTILREQHVRSLLLHGFCMIDGFVSIATVGKVFALCKEFVKKTQTFVSTHTEEDFENMEEPPDYLMFRGKPESARGDMLSWLDAENPPATVPPLKGVFDRYRVLQQELARVIRLQGGKESQMAYYPNRGIGYRRHRDTVPDDGTSPSDNRRITAITYCNPEWDESHGGKLRVWLSRRDNYTVIEIDPRPGRLFLFLSGVLDHEVRPAYHERVAVTTWYW